MNKRGTLNPFRLRFLSRMILRSQAVVSLIKTGRGRLEEAEYFPKRKTSLTFINLPERNSKSSSISDFNFRIESFSGRPKRTRLQALESVKVEVSIEEVLVEEGVTFTG